jgi:hypothetical protein
VRDKSPNDPETLALAALLRFLEAHEPDLIDVSRALGVGPEILVQERRDLEEGP